MFSTLTSGIVCGISALLTKVEVDTATGMPGFDMVGFLSSEVREARERVRVALKNSGHELPLGRVTVNISPANIKKEGSGFELPIAMGILCSLKTVPAEIFENTLLVGELGLSGDVGFVRGILPIVIEAKQQGIKKCIVPAVNAAEAGLVSGIEIIGVNTLSDCIHYAFGIQLPVSEVTQASKEYAVEKLDFSQILGQAGIKKAALIAAAGLHNLMIVGPPGSGKTMAAKRLHTIMPPLSEDESLEVSKIYSISGKLHSGLIKERPFISPHHTISRQALAGGGTIPKPGLISLAHRGVLHLDETPDFGKAILDTLRQPLEDGYICVARSQAVVDFPAQFMLVCTMNPCPCGYYPDTLRCRCSPRQVDLYQGRLSGPILDRIDLVVNAPKVAPADIIKKSAPDELDSTKLRGMVMSALEIQKSRYKNTNIAANAQLKAADIERFCPLGEKEQAFVEKAFERLNLSARGYHRVLKVARTVADLEGVENISTEHLAQAIHFRVREKFM